MEVLAPKISTGAKTQIIKMLREQGYPRYAKLAALFDIYLTADPRVIGYMVPDKAKIVLNEDLNIYQVSAVVRHEILHEYFSHGPRIEAFDATHKELGSDLYIANTAADFEISNRGYTSDDKANMRALKIGDEIVHALVTEDHYPEWKNLSFEEMYEKLLQEKKKNKEKLQNLMKDFSRVSQKDMEDLGDMIDKMKNTSSGKTSDSTPQQSQPGENSGKGNSVDQDNSAKGGNSGEENNSTAQSVSGEDDKEGSSNNSKGSSSLTQDSSQSSASSSTGSDSSSAGSDSSQSSASSQGPDSKEGEKLDKLQDEVAELDKQLDKIEGGDTGNSKEFPTPEEQQAEVDIAARVKEIFNELRDMNAYNEIVAETNAAIRKDNIARARRNNISNYAKRGNGGLHNFKMDLQRFISSELSYERERSWERPDTRYKRRGFLVQGSITRKEEKVPVINVYWDTSGSFSNPAKTAGARAAINSIQQYVKKGLIDVNVYYHSNDVYDHPVSGGNDGDNVVDHIKATRPDNIIIITDSDLSNTKHSVTVPGAAWFLFYDAPSQGLIDNVHGRKQSKWYMVEY